MMRLALLLCVLAGPAFALSCKPQNFAADFNRVAAAAEVYSLVYGELIYEGQSADEPVLSAQFKGRMFGRVGRGAEEVIPITITRECTGGMCAPVPPPGTVMLAFLEQRGARLHLYSGLCAPDYALNPSLGRIAAIRACMRAGQCGDEELQAFDLNR